MVGACVLASACSGGPNEESGGGVSRELTTVSVSESVSLAASKVQDDGSVLVVDQVELESPGYAVVYEDGGGAPGRVLAVSDLLSPGVSRDVRVELDEPLAAGSGAWLMLHGEDGQDEGFDHPGGDPPLEGDAGVAAVRVGVEADPGP